MRIFPFDATVKGFNKIAAGNGRVLLFLLPSLVLLVTAGVMELLASPLRYVHRIGLASAALVIGAPLYYALTGLPYSPHDLRPILTAMGLPVPVRSAAIRVSFSMANTEQDVDTLASAIADSLAEIEKLMTG